MVQLYLYLKALKFVRVAVVIKPKPWVLNVLAVMAMDMYATKT
ncbi:MAG: hypothetical protein ACI8QY_000741 [bacterium]|jgi:hypothetical protein